MGRPYTGAATVYSEPRLELSYLRKLGFFEPMAEVTGNMTWTNGDEVRIVTRWNKAEIYMDLSYTWTHPLEGTKHEIRQRFDMVTRPSNLGKGSVLYFRCQRTGRLCRILYRAYHARDFRSRWGFSYRLYYPSQVCGKLNRWDEVYWSTERHLDQFKGRRYPSTFRGKPTKRKARLDRLLVTLDKAEEMRWSLASWPKRLFAGLEEMLRS